MAENKKRTFFEKKDNIDFIDDNSADFTEENQTDDFIDNSLDYDDFLSDLDNDSYYQSQDNQDYSGDFADTNFQDDYQTQEYSDDYSNQDYSDDYQFDDYSQPVSVDAIDDADAEEINTLLKNISDKLERLENRRKREVSGNAPFYAPNAMPYVVIPNQSSGNEVILNELAKLREENYRMQHSQEIQRQLNALKEELNEKLAALGKAPKNRQNQEAPQAPQASQATDQSILFEELQKINQKIEQLEAKTKGQDLNQILEYINRLETKLNAKSSEHYVKTEDEESLNDIINQIRNVSLKNDDVLAYIKSIRHALGLSAISHINEDGEIDYSNLKDEYSEFKKIISTGNLYAKLSAISKFNELIAELPVGVHEDIASDFYRIRNKVFGTILTPEIAAELIYNTTAADRERDIYYYFELKAELESANTYELPQVAEKFLKLRNRLQNNQYVTYNQNLFNDLIEANNDYEIDQSDFTKERLEKAKEIFSTLRIGDIVPINDYSKIRPSVNYRSITDKLNELHKLIKENDADKIVDLQSKLDSVIDEIKAVFGDQMDAIVEQITQAIKKVSELKDSIVVLSEQRHSELIQELADLKQEVEHKNPGPDLEYIKSQILILQEELRAKDINYELVLSAVNELKELFSALTDYTDTDFEETHSVTNEAILDEVRALKEQIYIQKGEFDPEILSEVRNLKELLASTKKEESYKDIVVELNNLHKLIEQNTLTSTRNEESYKSIVDGLNNLQKLIEKNALIGDQDYQTVLTSTLELLGNQVEQLTEKTEILALQDNEQLLKEIEALKAEIKAINIPTVIHEGDKVKLDYTELQQHLDNLNESINRLAIAPADDSVRDLAINVFRESMIEVLNEITNLKDEYIYQNEKNEALSAEINALKEQLNQYFEDAAQRSDVAIINELNELKELISSSAIAVDGQARQDISDELNAIKEQLNQNQENIIKAYKSDGHSQLLKHINELKENFLVSKADTDNTFIVETASIREQLNALKQTLDFNKISQDIDQLKSAVQNNKPQIDIDSIRQIIKDEINGAKSAELAVSVAAIERQLAELKKDFIKRQESDEATLNFMARIASLLEKQAEKGNFLLENDIQKIKEEINRLQSSRVEDVSEESQRFAQRLTSLKEDLSKIAKIADIEEDRANVLEEAVAQRDIDADIEDKTQESESQKDLLRKQLLEGGLPEESVNEIIDSIYQEDEDK